MIIKGIRPNISPFTIPNTNKLLGVSLPECVMSAIAVTNRNRTRPAKKTATQ